MALPVNGMGPFIQTRGNALEMFENLCGGPVPVAFSPPEGFTTPPPSITPDPDVSPDPNISPAPASPTPSPSPTPENPITASLSAPTEQQTMVTDIPVLFVVTNEGDPVVTAVQIAAPANFFWTEVDTPGASIVGNNVIWSGEIAETLTINATIQAEIHGIHTITGTATPTNGSPVVDTAELNIRNSNLMVGSNNTSGNLWVNVNITAPSIMYPPMPSPMPMRTVQYSNGFRYPWFVRTVRWSCSMQVPVTPRHSSGGGGFSVAGPVDFQTSGNATIRHSSPPPYEQQSRTLTTVRVFLPAGESRTVIGIPVTVTSSLIGWETAANQPEFIPPGANFSVPSGGYAMMSFPATNTQTFMATIVFDRAASTTSTIGTNQVLGVNYPHIGSSPTTGLYPHRYQGRSLGTRSITVGN